MKDLDLTTLRYFVRSAKPATSPAPRSSNTSFPRPISKRLAQTGAATWACRCSAAATARGGRDAGGRDAAGALPRHPASANRVAQDMASFGAACAGRCAAGHRFRPRRDPADDVAAFMKLPDHREIHVDIQEALSRDIVRQLREGSASVGILWDAGGLEGLCRRPYRSRPAGRRDARRPSARAPQAVRLRGHAGLRARRAWQLPRR
jgi:hypothetical protein